MPNSPSEPKVVVLKNGPYLVSGAIPLSRQTIVTDSAGDVHVAGTLHGLAVLNGRVALDGGDTGSDENVVFLAKLSQLTGEVVGLQAIGEPGANTVLGLAVDPALGDAVPNRVRMYDDGTHGDQKAGDGVWSYAATLPAGRPIFYVYTNSGRPGQWEGLDVPYIRSVDVAAGPREEPLYAPVETFGRAYLQADPWHTNAAGYQLIARSVFDTVVQQETVRRHLARGRAGGRAAAIRR